MTTWDSIISRHDPGSQQYISVDTLLKEIAELGEATPSDIAQSRRRQNIIRLQCRQLLSGGYILDIGHETFTITDRGRALLEDETIEAKQDKPEKILSEQNWRITDFDELEPDIFKEINKNQFLEEPSNDYGLVNNDKELTRQRIRNVKNSRINRVMREFPLNEPVPKQCAHWVRAIVGIHFFPDANHRTAMATLSFLLDINGIAYPQIPGDGIERAVLKSKLIRALFVDVQFDNLWEEDEMFIHWSRYFRDLLCDVNEEPNRDYSIAQLQQVLNRAREVKADF